jgi:hypothetical protein
MSKALANVPGVTGGNSRESRVRNFLVRRPEGATRLILRAKGEDDDVTLMDWPAEAVNEDLAPTVLQILQDHMQDTELDNVEATLSWCSDAGRVLASMVLKDRARDLVDAAANDPLRIDTSAKGQIRQQMEQNERMHRLYIAGQATLQQAQLQFVDRVTKMNETILARNVRLQERIEERENELDAMAGMVREYAATAEAAVSERTESGVEKGIAVLMQLLPMLAGKRLPAPTPPAPPPRPAAEGEPEV